MYKLLGLGWLLYQLLKTQKKPGCETVTELTDQGLTNLQAKREARSQRAEQRAELNTQLRLAKVLESFSKVLTQ